VHGDSYASVETMTARRDVESHDSADAGFLRAADVLSALIVLAGLAVVAVFADRGFLGALAAMDTTPGVFADFDVYIDQARRLRSELVTLGQYWLYPPLLAWLLGGLAGLSPHAADSVWLWLQLLGAAGLMRLCSPLLAAWPVPRRWCVAFGLTIASFPVLHCLKWGQISVVILLLAVAGLRRRNWIGHALLGAAAALKMYPLAFAFMYLLRRDWRSFFAVSAIAFLLGVVFPIALMGPDVFRMFFVRFVASALRLGIFVGVESQSWGPLVERWFGRDPSGSPALLVELPSAARALLSYGGAIALLATTWWTTRRLPLTDLLCLTACLLALTIVMRPGWFHYFVILPVAQAGLLSRLRSLEAAFACFTLSLGLGLLATFGYFWDPGFFYVTRTYGLVTLSATACLIGLWCVMPRDARAAV
jgi:alpha-1,2-mannosyltransferase